MKMLYAILLLAIVSCAPEADISSLVAGAPTDEFVPTGAIIAGTASRYIDFNDADYSRTLDEGRIVLLYFSRAECTLCVAEELEIHAAFEQLGDPRVVGFHVDYDDDNADGTEEALARELDITRPQTKVLMISGELVLKTEEPWDRERYLSEIGALTGG